ncbi:diguanylate cyclase [Deinococcus sp.]|uniref:sensor domain-containing diguanylate cyclase n=1 Tax=Deinococcus sp. TaxID=47478 RepID=UPI0025DA28F3|nr:diguanylate cyclase [Deinococcus sp.]
MTALPRKNRLVLWLSLIVALGFLSTSLLGYLAARGTIRGNLTKRELPLTGDSVYSEVQRELVRPVSVSKQMAQDTFLRDWVTGGERDVGQISRYLARIQAQFGTNTSFFVSEATRRYYSGKGVAQTVRETDPRARWYFRVKAMQGDYELNVDPDLVNRNTMTVFINYRLLGDEGRFLGVTGVGVTINTLRALLGRLETRYGQQVYFVSKSGEVVLSSLQASGLPERSRRGSIRTLPGLSEIAAQVLAGAGQPITTSYHLGRSTVQVNSRFVPELGWYLVVEQDEAGAVAPFLRLLGINLAVGVLATLLVLGLTMLTVGRFQRRLEELATFDTLTGLTNRGVGEVLLEQSLRETGRSKAPLSLVLFDIDDFKQINDAHGHATGDAVIRTVARLARDALREGDILIRWGGEEFMAVLGGCAAAQASMVAEELRNVIADHEFGVGQPVTISLGAAQYRMGDLSSATTAQADQALYQAKRTGKNRVASAGDTAPLS